MRYALPWAVVLAAAGWLTPPAGRERLDGQLAGPDLLSPAALYQDVVIDGRPAAGFQFSAATFAVPDVAGYFLARWAAGSHPHALPLWVAGQFALLVVAGWLAARRFAAGRAWLAAAGVYLAGAVGGGLAGPDLEFLLPVWHTGALALTLAGLALADRPLVLFAVVAVGVFSDRLLVPYLVLPLAVLTVADQRFGRLLPLAGGTAVGLAAIRLALGDADPIGTYWATPDPTRLFDRGGRLLVAVGRELAGGNRLLLGAVAWYAAAPVLRPPPGLRAVSFLSLAGVGGLFLLGHNTDDQLAAGDWRTFGRYFVGPVGLAYLGWAGWLVAKPRPGLAVALAVGWLAGTQFAVPRFDLYPDRVRAVDAACAARGLTHGLGGYPDGKPCALLSRAGVTVRAVKPAAGLPCGLTGFRWLGHDGWFDPAGPPFTFVLVGDAADALPEPLVVAKLGEPAERVPVADRTLLVYGRPTDWRLARFAATDGPRLNAVHERTGAGVTYPGAALTSPPGVAVADTPALEKVATEGATPAGLATLGPYLRVGRAGDYRATLGLSATAPGSAAEAVWVRADGSMGMVLATAPVPVGDSEVSLDFGLNRHRVGGLVEFRLRFGGTGRAAVKWARFAPR